MLKSILKQAAYIFCLALVFVIIDYFFRDSSLAYINNKYIFGLVGTNLVAVIISIIVLMILWLLFRKYQGTYWPLMIISAATLSNLLDRLFYGGVVDYIKIFSWPYFNIADVAIIVGFIFIIKALIQNKEQ